MVNNFDTHTFTINLTDPRVALFERDTILEVWRKHHGITDWYREYCGFHITPQRQITEDNRQLYVSYGRSITDLISRRVIRYYAGTAYVAKTGPGETVMKEYVIENAGSLATSPPRITDGVTTGLIVEADGGLGSTWEGSRPWANLLDVLQDIASATSVDFQVQRSGAWEFTFSTYYPQLGTDRRVGTSDPVVFSVENANMEGPLYVRSGTEEINNVLVLGQGEEDSRVTVERVNQDSIDESPVNLREINRDARQESAVAGLESVGDALLEEGKAQENFTFEVIQTDTFMYGRDYFLGDLVTAQFTDLQINKKIVRVAITVAEGQENIDIELGDIVNVT